MSDERIDIAEDGRSDARVYSTFDEVIDDIEVTLGAFAPDFDMEVIGREAFAYDAAKQGFVQVVDISEFWEIVESNALSPAK